jgi:hypothetical protein
MIGCADLIENDGNFCKLHSGCDARCNKQNDGGPIGADHEGSPMDTADLGLFSAVTLAR